MNGVYLYRTDIYLYMNGAYLYRTDIYLYMNGAYLHRTDGNMYMNAIYLYLNRIYLYMDGLIPVHVCHIHVLYNWLIWRVLKLRFFSKRKFPCIYFGVCNSQNNAIYMQIQESMNAAILL